MGKDGRVASGCFGCLTLMCILGLAGVGGGAYLMISWERLPGLAKAAAIVALVAGTLCLAPAVLWFGVKVALRLLFGKIAKAMGKIVEDNKAIYGQIHTYRPAQEGDFAAVDRGFYERAQSELEAAGFRHVGDIVDEVLEAMGKTSPPIRVLVAADGLTTVGLFHLAMDSHLAGGMPMLVCDVATEFSDGTFLATSSTEGVDLTTPPPQIHRQQCPLGTPANQILAMHEAKRQEILAGHDGLACVACHTLDEALASEQRMQAIKMAFRKSIGYVDPNEVRRVSEGLQQEQEVTDLSVQAADAARKKAAGSDS